MEYEMGMDLKKSGFLAVMPFVMQIVGKVVFGVFADALLAWGVGVSATRKIMTLISSCIASISLFFVPGTTNGTTAVCLFAFVSNV